MDLRQERNSTDFEVPPKVLVPVTRVRRSPVLNYLCARNVLIAWSILSFFVAPLFLGTIRIECLLLLQTQVIFFSAIMIFSAVYKETDMLRFLRGMTELFLILSLLTMVLNIFLTAYDIYRFAFHNGKSHVLESCVIQALGLMFTAAFFTQFVLIDETINEIQEELEEEAAVYRGNEV